MKSAAKKSMLVMVLALAGSAFAQTAPPAPDYTLSYNVGATTDYRYRGISQSGKKPALNGGIDYAHSSGFYLGTWASTITWLKDSTANPNTTKGPIEIDVYGGYKGALSESVGYDVGGLYYWYAGNNLKKTAGFVSPNTFELYGALTFGIVTAKYSHATTNLFGTANSKNSGYLDLSANFDLGSGWSIVPHVGAQKIKNGNSYTDYSVAVNKDIDGLVVSLAVVGTNGLGGAYTLPGSGTRDLAKDGLVLSIKKSF
ncbi:MAG: TorF family putative porin [Polaromonas sp.]|uniref:TorF family putative porin n=1 Tax=Polaromonas sp. TaxID=1869339 RepID=UPI00271AD73F|nr:TorF family putative porin [Polaromonas sp.]MDO9116038.1 TorF family putative porin [Polaromonas sp.]MDP1886364.1 TorF family putative porin [Polaromonas sp.]